MSSILVSAPDDWDSLGQFTSSLGTLTNAVDFAILILTILGAGGVITLMLLREYNVGKGSTLRSRLVLFLVFGDFYLGCIVLIPTASTLSGHPPRQNTSYCNAIGFVTIGALWGQHFNTLVLCVSTYLILIYPLSPYTRLLERHWRWLFPAVWVASYAMSGIAWGVIGNWGYNNGICFYPPGLFSEIYQFVPRLLVFIIITLLYLRLFVFLRRPDRIRTGSTTPTGYSTEPIRTVETQRSRWRRWSARTKSVGNEGDATQPAKHVRSTSLGNEGIFTKSVDFANEPRRASLPSTVSLGGFARRGTGGTEGTTSGNTSSDVEKTPKTKPAPWEAVELPRFSGSVDPISTASTDEIQPAVRQTSGWRWGHSNSTGFGGQDYPSSIGGRKDGPSSSLPTAMRKSNSALRVKLGDESGGESTCDEMDGPARRSSHVSFSEGSNLATYNIINVYDPSLSPLASPQDAVDITFTSPFQPSSSSSLTYFPPITYPPSPLVDTLRRPSIPDSVQEPSFHSPISSNRPSDDATSNSSNLMTPPIPDRLPRNYLLAPKDPIPLFNQTPNTSYSLVNPPNRCSLATSDIQIDYPPKGIIQDEESRPGERWEEEDTGEELTLQRVLDMTAPLSDMEGGYGRDGVTTGHGTATGSGSDNQESMARFMNRKASLLMLTFPLGYVLLFSVSIIRLSYDFANTHPVPALNAVSRWMIFCQGLLDAIIYGAVETCVKRQVRKKTRNVRGESQSDPHASIPGSIDQSRNRTRSSQQVTSRLR